MIKSRSSFVDGRFEPESGGLPVEDPARGEMFMEASAASAETFERAIMAARRAFDDARWSGLTVEDRAAAVTRLLDHLDTQRDALIETMVRQTGCPVRVSRAAQVDWSLALGRELLDVSKSLPDFEYAPIPLEQVTRDGVVRLSAVAYEAIGVASIVTPYNFPLFMDIAKVVPALMSGCTVVLRPSPLTPLTAPAVAEAALAAELPAGVLNVVLEHGIEGGRLMSSHPAVDFVSFTGSSAVGRAVMAQAADTVKRLQLELGGKSAQVYLPEAADRAGAAGCAMFYNHAGQFCGALTRMLVPEGAKAEILEQLAATARTVVVGDPADEATQMGPVISAAQLEKCERSVALAVEAGATVVAGGGRPDHLEQGYYFEPTVLDCPNQDNPAVRDEIFGPVLCVLGYRDIDHAVEMANDTPYGLSGSVFGPADEALAVARRIRSGQVGVNGTSYTAWTPFGGWGQSGVGVDGGVHGARQYQVLKHIPITA